MPGHGNAGRDFIAQGLPIASQLHESLALFGCGQFLHHRNRRGLEFRQLLPELGDGLTLRLRFLGDVAHVVFLELLHLRRGAFLLRCGEEGGHLLFGNGGLGVQPSVEAGQPGRFDLGEDRLRLGQALLGGVTRGLLRGRDDLHRGAFVGLVGVGGLIEHGVGAEVLGDRDRVVLVGVALGACHGRAHPDGVGRVDAVDDGGGAVLFIVRAPFVLGHRVAVESRGDQLLLRRIRQQVARELLDGEPVEALVGVEGADDPVAVGPDGPSRVAGVAGAVGVARHVEPAPRPMLSEGGLRQVVVDEFRGARLREAGQLGGGRRQAREVERGATNQEVAVGRGREGEFFLLQSFEQERVDRVGFTVGRDLHRHHGLIGPMLSPAGPLADPRLQQGHLFGTDDLVLLRGRHHVVRVLGFDALDDGAQFRFARDDGDVALAVGFGRDLVVEPQPGFPGLVVGAVTRDAVFGQDRADLAAEVDGVFCLGQGEHQDGEDGGTQAHKGVDGVQGGLVPPGLLQIHSVSVLSLDAIRLVWVGCAG